MQVVKYLLICSTLICSSAFALPIDIHGVFGVDSTAIDNYRNLVDDAQNAEHGVGAEGSQEVPFQVGSSGNASYQSYVLRISPVIIINDSASFISEFNVGYGRGGLLGMPSSPKPNSQFDSALTMLNIAQDEFTKYYFELYTNTATWLIGRHTAHWGLGAIVNSGKEAWSRNTYIRDGVTMKLKFGNFFIEPYYAKVASANSLTIATNESEYGGSLLYKNLERDISLGILYSRKTTGSNNTDLKADMDFDGTTNSLGEISVTLIDIYLKKAFGDLVFSAEIPLLSGDLGNVYGAGEVQYKAKAIIFESNYKLSKSWNIGVNAGTVSGHDGSQSTFGALYLHPNYQIANLMFRYNRAAVANPETYSIYDSYLTNVTYAKFFATYNSDKWRFKTSFIWAQADQVAKASSSNAHNHLYNNHFDPGFSQSNDLGFEIDFDLDYKWNDEINFGASLGYHFVGDYYAYTNNATPNETSNSFSLVFRSAIKF